MNDGAGSSGDDMEVNGEIRRLRHKVVKLEALLEQLQRQQSSLLAMAVHDLRTPLTIIQGYAQLLSIELMSTRDPTIDEYTTNILAHAEVLGNMIENLVALDQIERGQLRLTPEPCDLNVLVDNVLAQVEGLLKVKSLQISFDPAPGAAWINGDEHQIRRGLYNLLSHTAKYARPDSQLRVDVVDDGSFCYVRFRDPHRILPADVLLQLFTVADFQQGGRASSLHGMDLGLILVRHIAEQHGGRVSASCSPGQGMTLALYLPASEP
ncbi:MAG: HAMP domain-containing histidine kinase [Anaerolineae bacterium]|uniref:sensor histidine kinase n=1 Tax=Promineifilum sp. TaxID=2664178 RepID=UPI001D629EED|nr:HAMP domain-containing histidine kinase [Anaerolineales bacterium]MCB8934676.1 HAMP domain-containing histidine kinase [Promineifilum sp.]MCO5180966.1 HAMP domain-containing histidine kinase [Promineifilum sp.]MCW5846672.1 HAMP domain-containing histidine kinase [Anaerolineae bacterium]